MVVNVAICCVGVLPSAKEVGRRVVTTPTVMTLPKSKENITVQCQKGCAKGSGIIASNTEGMTAGNVLLGGAIGLEVDAASGAMNKYTDQNQVALTPDPSVSPISWPTASGRWMN
jgi:hypothetical protein